MTASTAAPFPGLRPFTKVDAPWFFGRDEQIKDLRGRLDRNNLIAVVGGSGVGKSSLVYAGLLPQLEKESSWRFVDMRPRGAPRVALAEAFIRMLTESELVTSEEAGSVALVDHVRATLARSAFGLVDLTREWLPEDGEQLLLLVDQFEEIFRYQPQKGAGATPTIEDEAAAFVALLLTAALADSVPIRVLLTMRADYIGDCIRFEGLPEAISEGQYLVPRLIREQLEAVIRKPVIRAGAMIDHDLVEQLLNDSAKEFDALPVLQHALMRLWEEAGKQDGISESGVRRLTMDLYIGIGGMSEVLSRHADSAMEELAGSELGSRSDLIIEQMMRSLTEVDHQGRAIRRPIPFRQLVHETGFGRPELKKIIETMRAETRSFLRPGPQDNLDDDTVIDVGHEALIRHWRKIEDPKQLDARGRPTGWLRDEERDGQIYRALLELAEESERAGGTPLPEGQIPARSRWWSDRRRTDAWAQRYGGGRDKVVALLRLSQEHVKRERERRRRERETADALERERAARERELFDTEQKRKRRNTWLVFLGSMILILSGALLVVSHQKTEAERQREAAVAARQEAERQREAAVAAKLEAERQREVAEIADDKASAAQVQAERFQEIATTQVVDRVGKNIEKILIDLQKTEDPFKAAVLAQGLVELTDQLTPEQSKKAIQPLLKFLRTSTVPGVTGVITQTIRALASRLPDTAIIETASTILDLIVQETNPVRSSDLAQALAALLAAPKVPQLKELSNRLDSDGKVERAYFSLNRIAASNKNLLQAPSDRKLLETLGEIAGVFKPRLYIFINNENQQRAVLALKDQLELEKITINDETLQVTFRGLGPRRGPAIIRCFSDEACDNGASMLIEAVNSLLRVPKVQIDRQPSAPGIRPQHYELLFGLGDIELKDTSAK